MIKKEWSEKEYRACKLDSFSSIKGFLEDRNKYYKKYVLGNKVNEDDESTNVNLRIGSLVDCLLFSPEVVDEKFVTTSSIVPKKQMMDFVQNLYKRTLINTTEEGVVTRNLSDLIEDAYNDTKYDKGELVAFKAKTLEKLKEEFIVKKIGYDYYIDLRNRGDKFVITMEELQNAQKTVDILKNHKYTKKILEGKGYTIYNQLILVGKYRDLDIKCMIDRVMVDEEKKIVYSYDLKTTWNVDDFDYNYLKYKYYLQCALYTEMLREYFSDYTVYPMRFIVTDKIGYMDPIIYYTTEEHIQQGKEGFNGNRGLISAVEDIKYHKQTGIWTSSAEVQRQHGTKQIKLG